VKLGFALRFYYFRVKLGLQGWLYRQVVKVERWWVDPAPPPHLIGKEDTAANRRPIPIELGFTLHADGRVFWTPRGKVKPIYITDPDLKQMVYTEYNTLVQQAKKHFRIQNS
jgi:hypothetical protein